MATTIASQLEALKSYVQVETDPLKRPFTRPSVLFDPKEAADIDIETILSIALQGLEVLINTDERFRHYKNDLFSDRSKDLDRELMGIEENNRYNASISSYLRLLSGHFQLPSALKTLEYLIRRYKIHIYNTEGLILCALPYHETHAFVRIVQLLDTRNSKWTFLDGVKVSGAPPPRKVIVQQCICDKAVLEVLCNYASASKKFQPSKHVISFCTAVFVEALGSVETVDDDIVKRILPFVVSGLQTGNRGNSDRKAGALMIVGLLGNKIALAPKLVNSLIRSITEVAREDARELTDLQSFRLSLMAIINLVQSQVVDLFPKKALDILKEIRDLAGILLELSKEFNIDRFLSVLLDSLIDSSSSDELCYQALVSIIELIPIKNSVHHVVTKVLSTCLKLSQKSSDLISSVSGSWAKKVLIVVNRKYPSELHGAVHEFLKENNGQTKDGNSTYKIVFNMLDENLDKSADISDSKIWLSLHHPKAEVRCATLAGLKSSTVLKSKVVDSQILTNIQEAILRQLHDDDLTVVQAALSMDGLSDVIHLSDLVEALSSVLRRCIGSLQSGSSDNGSLTGDVALACLKNAMLYFQDHTEYLRTVAAMMFPLLLILPKTQRLNRKALELAKETKWPLYQNLVVASTAEVPSRGSLSLTNLKTIIILAEKFSISPKDNMAWFVESCNDFDFSKTLYLLVLMQSFQMQLDGDRFSALFESAFPILKTEWDSLVTSDDVSVEELQFNSGMLDWDCSRFLDHLLDTSLRSLNAKILICIFWRLLASLISTMPSDIVLDGNEKWVSRIKDLFIFFATSKFKHVFSEHLHYLIAQSKISPVHLLSKFFTDEGVHVAVQVESLQCFAFLCIQSQERWPIQLLAEFPSVLVPLASEDQDLRIAAMNCIEALLSLWTHVDFSGKKNGSNAVWSHFIGELLGLMVQQKRLLLSHKKFLSSLFTSLLSSSSHSLVAPQNIEHRFDQSTKEKILAFILGSALKFPDYGKLMILSMLKGIGNVLVHVVEVESLLTLLMRRRNQYYSKMDKSCQKLSEIEVKILCLLLESCVMLSSSGGSYFEDFCLKALRVDNMAPEDPAVIQPCITILNKLNGQLYSGLNNEVKDHLFCELVCLFRNPNGSIQNAAREALLLLDISYSTIGHMLDLAFKHENCITSSAYGKKKKKLNAERTSDPPRDSVCIGGNVFCFVSSLLDILLLKKDIASRHLLIAPLFKFLGNIFSEEWLNGVLSQDENLKEASSSVSEAKYSTICHIQQTLLIILADIILSLRSSVPVEIRNDTNVKMLVECARNSNDGVTRNHIFSLISSIARVIPEKLLEHIPDILVVVGESAVSQIDSHSQHVFEDIISAVVPCWISKTDNVDKLLQIFIDVLPDVAEHRRLSIVVYLLRTLGECKSLASLLVLLFRSLVSRKGLLFLSNMQAPGAFTSYVHREWEYAFVIQICEQYMCVTWLPALVMLLRQIGNGDPCQELFLELLFAMQFTLHKLQDPELAFKLESGKASDGIQTALEELMEQVVFLLQLVDGQKKLLPVVMRKEFKESIRDVLRNITMVMIPSAYFTSIIKLLRHTDRNVGKKAVGLLCEMARDQKTVLSNHKDRKRIQSGSSSRWLHMDESSQEAFNKMCLEIVRVVDDALDNSSMSLKLAAVSALEVLASRFPSNGSIFSVCLASVMKCITSCNSTVISSCLRTTGALINVLGPKALAELPHIMENVIKLSREVSPSFNLKTKSNEVPLSSSNESLLLSVLFILEAVVDKLGGFLNPYLADIIELLVLHSEYASESGSKMKLRAHTVRKLIAERIPVRLLLPPLLKVYPRAVQSGDSSLAILFDMLVVLVGTLDRSSITGYHRKIFDLCLLALDLRHQHPVSVQNVNLIEKGVINALISLSMKLTESMFRPLFIRSIEWAESEMAETASVGSMDRAISFYGLVNKLAENQRSLFVPYFKYLLDGCVRHLNDVEDENTSVLSQKKKKAKILEEGAIKKNSSLSVKNWHLRALVLSSLHKCFLYDTRTEFLNSSKFQMLLKPIISQLVVEPPPLGDNENVPTVKEVDDLLVTCIGQMAVTAGNDLLWKPLNHEVLMQTRSEKVRSRILGLRIIRYLLENLKEEYLVFLAETIPFLGELLEDVELSVKSLAQEILKEMESMSGENLSQYL
ncbi:U3 small nucleolar RNA-associated protein [Quillaja saponaria]|uniref:U3 small nucleolar RNA-associated protein n=1 Tax=Quillaja saponaria TaxID=32244 RepID=A0AAD7L115_QUISA|nr:U3 small nucleolar RNA-associated protein [Quillaja saponaria]